LWQLCTSSSITLKDAECFLKLILPTLSLPILDEDVPFKSIHNIGYSLKKMIIHNNNQSGRTNLYQGSSDR